MTWSNPTTGKIHVFAGSPTERCEYRGAARIEGQSRVGPLLGLGKVGTTTASTPRAFGHAQKREEIRRVFAKRDEHGQETREGPVGRLHAGTLTARTSTLSMEGGDERSSAALAYQPRRHPAGRVRLSPGLLPRSCLETDEQPTFIMTVLLSVGEPGSMNQRLGPRDHEPQWHEHLPPLAATIRIVRLRQVGR